MKDKIEIYMCDDEEKYFWIAKQAFENCTEAGCETEFTFFQSGDEIIEQCRNRCPDVLILDIDMPGMNGFEVAETIQEFYNDVLIIFLTSHFDMVYMSFKYHPFWFVRKSCIEELEIVVPALLRKLDCICDNMNSIKSIALNDGIYKIDVKTVKVISSYNHYIFWKDAEGKETKIRAKIQNVETQFTDLFFVKVQKGIMVNLRFISKINSRKVVLKDGLEVNISRACLQNVRDEFQRYIRSM